MTMTATAALSGPLRWEAHVRPSELVRAFAIASGLGLLIAAILVPSRGGARLDELLLEWCGAGAATHAMSTAGAQGRPASIATPIAVSDLGNGQEMTTILVKYPPYGFTPKHRHGGAVTAYILKGTVRSHVSGQELADFKPGQTFFEPVGSIHLVSENPSQTEPAELLATIVHPKGAALTTLIDD
jgi:quercetin dioxygenase-like cupin family protein